jgi:hypothetical protein
MMVERQSEARAGGDDEAEESTNTPPLHIHISGITGAVALTLKRRAGYSKFSRFSHSRL